MSLERALQAAAARYITGLTATPSRRDGHQPIIDMQCGPARHTIDSTGTSARSLHRLLIKRVTGFDPGVLPRDPSIHEIYAAIAADGARLRLVVDDVLAALGEGRYPLILTERRAHLDRLYDELRARVPALIVLHGGISARGRRDAMKRLSSGTYQEPRAVLATGRYIGEGFDDHLLDTLVLAMPIAWKGTLIQYAGRLQRSHSGKTEMRIYDYVDESVPVLRRMFDKRLRGYRKMGYGIE